MGFAAAIPALIGAGGSILGSILGGSGGNKSSSNSFSGTFFNSPFFSRLASAYPGLISYQYPSLTPSQSVWGVPSSQFFLPGFSYAGQGGTATGGTGGTSNTAPQSQGTTTNNTKSTYSYNPDHWGGMADWAKTAVQNGTAVGQKWNNATSKWEVVTGNPDIIWADSGSGQPDNSDKFYYKDPSSGHWIDTPYHEVQVALASGPTTWNNWYNQQKNENAKWGGMDEWARTAIQNGTATGLKWNGSTWENSNSPDMVLVGPEDTGKYYYKDSSGNWNPIAKTTVDEMKASGPTSFYNTPTGSGAAQGANRKWKKSDVAYAYQQLGPETFRKIGDLDRVWNKAGLDDNGEYTTAELRHAFDSGGDWSGTSRGIWESSMQFLVDQGSFLDSVGGTGTNAGAGALQGGSGGIYNATLPPDAPEVVLQAIGRGTATGLSWDPASRTWKEHTGSPDIVWWAPTNQLFYKGYSLTPEEYNYLMANGPGAMEEYDKYRRQIMSSPDLSALDPTKAPKASAPTAPYQTLPGLPGIKPPTVTAAGGPGDISYLQRTVAPNVPYAQVDNANYNVDPVTGQTLDFQTTPEFFQALLSHNFDPIKNDLEYQQDLERRQTNASLSARGLGTSASAEGTIGEVNKRYEELRRKALTDATANATLQFYDYDYKKASEEAQLRQQALQGNQQAQLQTQQLNAARAQANAQFMQQSFLTKAGYDMQALTQDQQNTLQVASLNLQKNLEMTKMRNEINLANAGFDFQAQTEMLKNILTGNLAQLESNTQVGLANAQFGMQAQQYNMQQYAQLIGLSTNAMMEIRNQMLQGMQLTQQDMARMDNYTLQALSMMLQDKYNFIASIVNASKISGSHNESSSSSGVA